jgi:hypothetical protein
MLIPVPQNLEGKRTGIAPVLTKALEDLLGPRGERWDLQTFFAPVPTYEIDIPKVSDAALFNETFPAFASGLLTRAQPSK